MNNDLISRQAAIKAVEKESQIDGSYGYMDTKSIVDLLEDLPSAQPDIIRCNDCTHRNGDYCHRFHDGYSAFIHCDDFCNYAKRREGE